VSVFPLHAHSGFDPEAIEIMSSALAKVCAELGLANRSDRMTELVARHIVEAAQKGMRTEPAIHQFAVAQFKSKPQ